MPLTLSPGEQDAESWRLYLGGIGLVVFIILSMLTVIYMTVRHRARGSCCEACCGGFRPCHMPCGGITQIHLAANIFYIFSTLFSCVAVPVLLHMAFCTLNSDFPTSCSWNLPSNASSYPEGTFFKKYSLAPVPTVAFGLIALIVEMLLYICVAMASIRYFTEASLNNQDGMLVSVNQGMDEREAVREYSWMAFSRKFICFFGLWTFVVGTIARIFVYSMFHASWGHGMPSVDNFVTGEGVVVLICTALQWLLTLCVCCKRTFGEDHLAYPDYATFTCGGCEGKGCGTCKYKGLLLEQQNLHHGPVIRSELED